MVVIDRNLENPELPEEATQLTSKQAFILFTTSPEGKDKIYRLKQMGFCINQINLQRWSEWELMV